MGQIGLDTLLAGMGAAPQMQSAPTYYHAPQAPQAPSYQQQILELLNKPVNYQAQMNALRPMIEAAYKPQMDFYNSLLARASNQNPIASGINAFGRGFNAASRNPYQPGWAAALQGLGAYGNGQMLEQQRADLIRQKMAETQGKQATGLLRMMAPNMRPLSTTTKINALTGLANRDSATKRWETAQKAREENDRKTTEYRDKTLGVRQRNLEETIRRDKAQENIGRARVDKMGGGTDKAAKQKAKLAKLIELKGNAISRGLDKIASDLYLEEDQRKQPEKLEDRIKWFNTLPDSIKEKYRTVARTIKKYSALQKKLTTGGKKIPAQEVLTILGAK